VRVAWPGHVRSVPSRRFKPGGARRHGPPRCLGHPRLNLRSRAPVSRRRRSPPGYVINLLVYEGTDALRRRDPFVGSARGRRTSCTAVKSTATCRSCAPFLLWACPDAYKSSAPRPPSLGTRPKIRATVRCPLPAIGIRLAGAVWLRRRPGSRLAPLADRNPPRPRPSRRNDGRFQSRCSGWFRHFRSAHCAAVDRTRQPVSARGAATIRRDRGAGASVRVDGPAFRPAKCCPPGVEPPSMRADRGAFFTLSSPARTGSKTRPPGDPPQLTPARTTVPRTSSADTRHCAPGKVVCPFGFASSQRSNLKKKQKTFPPNQLPSTTSVATACFRGNCELSQFPNHLWLA